MAEATRAVAPADTWAGVLDEDGRRLAEGAPGRRAGLAEQPGELGGRREIADAGEAQEQHLGRGRGVGCLRTSSMPLSSICQARARTGSDSRAAIDRARSAACAARPRLEAASGLTFSRDSQWLISSRSWATAAGSAPSS